MKKLEKFLGVFILMLTPLLQSCNDHDGYSIGDFSWDWATVRTTGSGGYYLEGDRWGIIEPVATAIPWFKPIDGERVVSFFNPLVDMTDQKGVRVKMEGIEEVLTKSVEEMNTENESEFGNDPIVIFQGHMWLGGKFLNLIFQQDLPQATKHRISLVKDTTGDTPLITEDGYVHLALRYNTYGDVSGRWGTGRVSFNLGEFYSSSSSDQNGALKIKGFKVTIHSKENGENKVIVLDLDKPTGIPENANGASSNTSIR